MRAHEQHAHSEQHSAVYSDRGVESHRVPDDRDRHANVVCGVPNEQEQHTVRSSPPRIHCDDVEELRFNPQNHPGTPPSASRPPVRDEDIDHDGDSGQFLTLDDDGPHGWATFQGVQEVSGP